MVGVFCCAGFDKTTVRRDDGRSHELPDQLIQLGRAGDGFPPLLSLLQLAPDDFRYPVRVFVRLIEQRVQRALQAGAIGYLLKDTSGAELVAAIRQASSGAPVLALEATQALISNLNAPPRPGADRHLAIAAKTVEQRSLGGNLRGRRVVVEKRQMLPNRGVGA